MKTDNIFELFDSLDHRRELPKPSLDHQNEEFKLHLGGYRRSTTVAVRV